MMNAPCEKSILLSVRIYAHAAFLWAFSLSLSLSLSLILVYACRRILAALTRARESRTQRFDTRASSIERRTMDRG
jgi:membrane protein implicated in regulation of membrane protease activity